MTAARTLLFLTAALVLLGVVGAAPGRAASITAESPTPAEPGAVVAIPVRIAGRTGTGTLTLALAAPRDLKVLGASTPNGGRALATLLVTPSAGAGPQTVTVTLHSGGSVIATTTVVVRVRTVVAATLRTGFHRYVVTGRTFTATLSLTNRGNAPEAFALATSGEDPMSVTPKHARLAPGAKATLRLRVTPQASGPRIGFVTAAAVGSSYVQQLVFAYHSLPFADTSPNAPVIDLHLPVTASYGTGGVRLAAGARANGALSDFVGMGASAAYLYPASVSAGAGLSGKDWSVEYHYAPDSGHSLAGSVGPLSGSVRYSASGALSSDVGYAVGPWTFEYDHSWAPGEADAASAGYGVSIAPWLFVRGRVGATGRSTPTGYVVGPLAAARAQWSAGSVLGNVGGLYAPRSGAPWRTSADLYSRNLQPVGFDFHVSVDPETVTGVVGLDEWLGPALALLQHASYSAPFQHPFDGSSNARFTVSYQLPAQLGSVTASVHAHLAHAQRSWSGRLFAVVEPVPWRMTIRLTGAKPWRLSLDQSYLGSDFTVGAGASATFTAPLQPSVDLHGAITFQPVTTGLTLEYQPATGKLSGSATASVQLTPTLSLTGNVAYGPQGTIAYRLGLAANLATGFQVPHAVVDAFGGRDVGTIRGRVVEQTTSGLKPLHDVSVVAASANSETHTNADGRFTFTLHPGTTQLQVVGLPLDLSISNNPTVHVRVHRTTHVTITLEKTLEISGQVYVAAGATGPASSSKTLPYVQVAVTAPDGTTHTTTADQNGNFVFGGLAPGRYGVALVASSLPDGYTPSEGPQSVTLGKNGSASVELGAAPPRSRVLQTLSTDSLALDAQVTPSAAPRGATVRVVADAPGATQVTARWASGKSVPLSHGSKGRFAATLTVPVARNAGTATDRLVVTAREGKHEVNQDLVVVVTPGPLASLTLSPGFATPGQRVQVTANVLTKIANAKVDVSGASVALTKTGPGTYTGSFDAPTSPGTIKVVLVANGKTLAHARLAVVELGS